MGPTQQNHPCRSTSLQNFRTPGIKNRFLKLPDREQEQKKVGEVSHKKGPKLTNKLMDACNI